MKFTVKWEVHYYDNDIKLYCDIDQDEDDVNTLDDILHSLCLCSMKRFGNFVNNFEKRNRIDEVIRILNVVLTRA